MFTIAFSVLLLASEAGSSTASAQPAPVAAQPAEAPKTEKKICKREGSSSTRLGSKRVCLTAEEWKARQERSVRDLGDVAKQ